MRCVAAFRLAAATRCPHGARRHRASVPAATYRPSVKVRHFTRREEVGYHSWTVTMKLAAGVATLTVSGLILARFLDAPRLHYSGTILPCRNGNQCSAGTRLFSHPKNRQLRDRSQQIFRARPYRGAHYPAELSDHAISRSYDVRIEPGIFDSIPLLLLQRQVPVEDALRPFRNDDVPVLCLRQYRDDGRAHHAFHTRPGFSRTLWASTLQLGRARLLRRAFFANRHRDHANRAGPKTPVKHACDCWEKNGLSLRE